MNLAHLQPVADDEPFVATPRPACEPPTGLEPSLDEPRSGRRAYAWVLLALALVTFAAAGAWWLWWPAPSNAVAQPTATPAERLVPPGLAGFAELFVATYLTSTGEGAEDSLRAFTSQQLAVESMVPHTRYVTRAEAIEVTPRASDYWSATIAAEVLDLSDDGYLPAGLQYYSVAIIAGDSGYAAAGLPSRIPPPEPPRIEGVARIEADPTAEQQLVATGFLNALLTGGAEIGRFLTPDSELMAIEPAPYAAVTISDLRSATVADRTYLRALVTAIGAAGHAQAMEYTLELAHNSQVWLVDAVHPGPPALTDDT